jgi:hypothetical protein
MSPATVPKITFPKTWRTVPCLAISGSSTADGRFHGLPGHDQFGQEGIPTAEALTDLVNASHKTLVDGFQRVYALRDGVLSQSFRLPVLSIDDALCHLSE